MEINQGNLFSDPGATATDNVDGNLTVNIVPTGTVDVNTPELIQLGMMLSTAVTLLLLQAENTNCNCS